MTLAQLFDQLAPSLPAYARKDVQTSIRVLATALGCPEPQQCLPEHYHQPLTVLTERVEDFLHAQGKGASTIRNTKNYLRRLFHLAETNQLLSLRPAVLTPRFDSEHKPPRPGRCVAVPNGTYLRWRHWPAALQDAFGAFQAWATAPVVPGRPASFRKRLSTIETYRTSFESYFGYLHYQQRRVPTFEDLFDIELVSAYVHWHINDFHERPTVMVVKFLTQLLAMTHQYRPNEELRIKLKALQHTLPTPTPFYNKDEAWVSLAELEAVGLALWPRKHPKALSQSSKHPGRRHAVYAGISLMLRLWRWIPYRQRNMREMHLPTNLHQDSQGHWRITFRGEQLKIGVKRGKTNIFDLPFPPELLADLETYLTLWRPALLGEGPQPDTHVFLNRFGRPYNAKTLRDTTKKLVYRYIGKHWHPHMIRTVWATEWIRGGGDFFKAAIMLNDTLETVIANYAHLRDHNVAEEVFATLAQRNGHGT